MNQIKVVTGQHVTIDYKPASLIHRILAALIDGIFQLCYIIAFLFIFSNKLDDDFFNNGLYLFIFCIFLIPILFYHFLFEAFMNGQTPGKVLMKIKVTNLDGSVTGLGGYFLRWILRPIDMLFSGLVGILFILLSQNYQRLGDMAAGTIVVNISKKTSGINAEYYSFGKDYQVQFPQAEKLSVGQIKLITDILEIPIKDEYDSDHLDSLAEKVESVLQVKSNYYDSRDFLIQVVKDYNYFATLGF